MSVGVTVFVGVRVCLDFSLVHVLVFISCFC